MASGLWLAAKRLWHGQTILGDTRDDLWPVVRGQATVARGQTIPADTRDDFQPVDDGVAVARRRTISGDSEMTHSEKATRNGIGLALCALCAAGGTGLLIGAATAEPPRPPQPPAHAANPWPGAVAPPTPASSIPDMPPRGLPRSEPTRIEIPAISVKADLLPLGLNDRKEMATPPFDRAHMAGWYSLGPTPGEPGSAIIVGHVDSEKLGPAVFFHLGKLKPGDRVTVHRRDGQPANFTVTDIKSYPKAQFPTEVVYGGTDAPTLKVITCGGDFDKKTRNYLSNLVVFATHSP